MSTRARNIPPARTRASHTPRPRGAGQGNTLTRTTWLHLLHLGGRAQRPLPVYQAIKAQAPDTTRAHTATMLARTMGNMITYQFADRANAGTGKGAQYS